MNSCKQTKSHGLCKLFFEGVREGEGKPRGDRKRRYYVHDYVPTKQLKYASYYLMLIAPHIRCQVIKLEVKKLLTNLM